MTSPMHSVFSDPDRAPDFTCLSLYKIFGFPDLGALVVRKQSGHIVSNSLCYWLPLLARFLYLAPSLASCSSVFYVEDGWETSSANPPLQEVNC